jgi:hypothetical protein
MRNQTSRLLLLTTVVTAVTFSTLTSTIAMGENPPSQIAHSAALPGVKDASKHQAVDPAIAKAAITRLLLKVDTPSEQPTVYRTTIEGNYAIATWTWGEAGGQTILAKKQGRWQVLGSGGGAVNVATLKTMGVPDKTARVLMQKELAAQKK